jgi:toxin ParE1/3/4
LIPIRYHEAAEEELLNEIVYLEDRSEGLGRRFFGEIRRSETMLERFPESAPEILPGIRKHIMRKFQYSLIYSIEPDSVLVLAVAHHKRRPAYWIGRTGLR